MIENGKFICTPAELMERVDNALNEISGCTLTAGTKVVDGELHGVVWSSSGKAVFATTFLGTGEDETITSKNATNLRGFLGYCYDEDTFAYVSFAFIGACDPSLTFEEVRTVAKETLATCSGNGVGEYVHNGVKYIPTYYSGNWLFGVTVAE